MKAVTYLLLRNDEIATVVRCSFASARWHGQEIAPKHSLTSEARAPISSSLQDDRKIPPMSQSTALALASLFIGLLWSYRAVTRKEYSDFVLAAVFLVLAILVCVRK